MFVPIPFTFTLSDATTVTPVVELDMSAPLHASDVTSTVYDEADGLDLGLYVPP